MENLRVKKSTYRVSCYHTILSMLLLYLVPIGTVQAEPSYDLSTEKVLYTVGTAHLDTQWQWTIKNTIDSYIKKTLDDNFSRFEKYPGYIFNFEGAFRYMLMKEYYPQRYQTMADYIDQGRWHITGSTLEQGDMNVVSPESMIRQTLIGNNYFEDEFGKRSTDIFLPDCFGFSYTMPTWMSHCGLNGFSSQKLSWGGAVPEPFSIGVWQGPDGSSVIAALKPGAYNSQITSDLSNDQGWLNRINSNGNNYGVYAEYMYHGVGDTGGAPTETSCQGLLDSMAGTGPVKVVSAGSDDIYKDITPAQRAGLPVYDGELLMTQHGSGCYTSQAAMKRWNRKNELLGDSAERAAVMAELLGADNYPQEILDAAWIRFLWHSFHDDLTGTSIPEAYHYSWNDEILSMNQFAGVMESSIGGVCQGLNTNVEGKAVVVYNPLALDRSDIVEATVTYETEVPDAVKVYADGVEVPSQIIGREPDKLTILFAAELESVSLKVFDVRSSEEACSLDTGLSIDGNVLENELYRVVVNGAGDISSIYDKVNSREILAGACRLELLEDHSTFWPAWEITYDDVQRTPYGYVSGLAKIRVVENGPVRVALEVTRTCGEAGSVSTFIQKIALTAGNAGGDKVVVNNLVDWRTKETMVKAVFPLNASNGYATYDLGMGTIERSNNKSNMHEVPAQQWADITDADGGFGVAILSECKYGWDKPADNKLRLTLLHTPEVTDRYVDEGTLDIGQHKFSYAIAPHSGGWDDGLVPQAAAGFNQQPVAFESEKHDGVLGQEYSMVEISNPQVMIKVVKKAERSNEIIVRVQELYGRSANNVRLSFDGNITAARQVDGCERYLSDLAVDNGDIVFDIDAYEPMTFAVEVASGVDDLGETQTLPLSLSHLYNVDAFSYDSNRSDGNLVDGMTIPAELMTDTLVINGVDFNIGSRANGSKNAVSCARQALYVGGGYDSIYILAASRRGDTTGTFLAGGHEFELTFQDYNEKVVDWGREFDTPYLKQGAVGWVGTHRHQPSGNMAYDFCNMFLYKIEVPDGVTAIILPDNEDVIIFAMTRVNSPADSVAIAGEVVDSLPYIPALAPKSETRRNLALNVPVNADGNVGGEIPEQAVDGTVENNSKWCATGNGGVHWLTVDLQNYYDIDTFVLYNASAGGESASWNTRDYCIQYSEDGGSNWEDLVCVEGNTSGVSRHTISPVNARYLRLYITDPTQNDDEAVRLYGFNVYGPCDGHWMLSDVSGPDGIGDCQIDLYDMEALAEDWLLCNKPMDPDCYSFWLSLYPDTDSEVAVPGNDLAALPDNSLVAYWKVQESSGGILNDTSAHGNSGTLQGSSLPVFSAGWFPQDGYQDKSLYFNGSGYVEVVPNGSASSPNLYNLTDEISLSAWIKPDDWGGNRRIMQKGNSDNQYRLLAENGGLVFEIYAIGRITTELPSTGVWHHIAGTYDGSVMKLFVDGVEMVRAYASGSINITNDNLFIATKNSGAPASDHFKGYLDDIRVYSVGLSEAQVRQLACMGKNAVPVILDIHKRDDLVVSLIGSTSLDAVVFDVNGDSMTYFWTELDSLANVRFVPSVSVEDPGLEFGGAGDYEVSLTVVDAEGATVTKSVELHLEQMDIDTIKALNLQIIGDINADFYVDINDFSSLAGQWFSGQD